MALGIIGLTRKIECLAAQSKLIYWITSLYYRNVINKEIKLADITSKDHVLCIGGGICPLSAILFHQKTGAKVTVIDNCFECTREAQKVISNLGLTEYVNAIHKDAGNIDFPLSGFSVVHFALQTYPMEYVFAKVRKQITCGTKLLVRKPKKPLNKLYSQLTDAIQNCCNYIIHPRLCNIGCTLLYTK